MLNHSQTPFHKLFRHRKARQRCISTYLGFALYVAKYAYDGAGRARPGVTLIAWKRGETG